LQEEEIIERIQIELAVVGSDWTGTSRALRSSSE